MARRQIRSTPKAVSPRSAAAVGPFSDNSADAPASLEASDDELGIGQDHDSDTMSLEAMMATPHFSNLLEAAVAAKLKSMGRIDTGPMADTTTSAFEAYLSRFDHMLQAQAEQQPGYKKPLPVAELDARKRGKKDMFELLRRTKDENVWPHYLLNDEANPFYGPSANGPILYQAGQEIKTRLPPSEGFRPLNESAIRIYEAYKRWVGEVVPIEALVAQAAADARGDFGAPEIDQVMRSMDPEVHLVDTPLRNVAPQRVLGTLTPEARGRVMPQQPGIVAQPTGPVFVEH